MFGHIFDSVSAESVNLITSGLVGAGRFVIKEETIPTVHATLIANLFAGNKIVSPAELRRQGIKLVVQLYAHCKEQLALTDRPRLPIGTDAILIDMAVNALGLNVDFHVDVPKYYANHLQAEATAKRKSEKLASATGASKPKVCIRFNQMVQQNENLDRVVTVSPLDAPGLIYEVHEQYPLIADTLQFDNTLSWDNRHFRVAVASLNCLDQRQALARFTRDPMVNDKDWMPAALLAMIENKIADILASSIEDELTKQSSKSAIVPTKQPLQSAIVSTKQPSKSAIVSTKQLLQSIVSTKQPSKSAIVSTKQPLQSIVSTKQPSKSAIVSTKQPLQSHRRWVLGSNLSLVGRYLLKKHGQLRHARKKHS